MTNKTYIFTGLTPNEIKKYDTTYPNVEINLRKTIEYNIWNSRNWFLYETIPFKHSADNIKTNVTDLYTFIINMIYENVKISKVCELGCGYKLEGLKKLRQHYPNPDEVEIVGIDFDERAIEKGKKNSFEIFNYDISTINLHKKLNYKKFDLIIMKDILEHTDSPSVALRNVNDLLTNSGIFTGFIPLNALGFSSIQNLNRFDFAGHRFKTNVYDVIYKIQKFGFAFIHIGILDLKDFGTFHLESLDKGIYWLAVKYKDYKYERPKEFNGFERQFIDYSLNPISKFSNEIAYLNFMNFPENRREEIENFYKINERWDDEKNS